eukprot:365525-Chlamydomonas_euryale.AAC.15
MLPAKTDRRPFACSPNTSCAIRVGSTASQPAQGMICMPLRLARQPDRVGSPDSQTAWACQTAGPRRLARQPDREGLPRSRTP